ncbi:MAG: hypothetical protein HY321_09875 [Armatimonadetes bacterium]|nr:hypothetical protein [Armatimonadota bacterium]
MKDKEIKEHPGGDAGELAVKPRHGGNIEAIRADYYDAEEMGVRAPRDIRAVGSEDHREEEEERRRRGKEFSGPGRQRDPDDPG